MKKRMEKCSICLPELRFQMHDGRLILKQDEALPLRKSVLPLEVGGGNNNKLIVAVVATALLPPSQQK